MSSQEKIFIGKYSRIDLATLSNGEKVFLLTGDGLAYSNVEVILSEEFKFRELDVIDSKVAERVFTLQDVISFCHGNELVFSFDERLENNILYVGERKEMEVHDDLSFRRV